MKSGHETLLDRLRPFGCPFHVAKALSQDEIRALHKFKDEVCEALEKLYKTLAAGARRPDSGRRPAGHPRQLSPR